MTLLAADVAVPGAITGSGNVAHRRPQRRHELAPFRFANKDVKMLAAEEPFEAGGQKFGAGAFIIPNADRAKLEASIKEFGLAAVAVASAPTVKIARTGDAAHRLRALLVEHPERGLGADGVRQAEDPVHLLRRHRSCASRTCARSTT